MTAGRLALGQRPPALGETEALRRARGFERRGGRLEHRRAGVAVDHDLSASPHEIGPEPEGERDAEAARHDGGVPGLRAAGERDGHHRAVELGDVRGPEVVGDEHDRVVPHRAGQLVGRARESRGAAAERADVLGARGEPLVAERGDRGGVLVAGAHDGLGRRPPGGRVALDRGVERRIGRHQRAGGDDVGLVVASAVAQARGDRLELGGRRRERGAGAVELGRAPIGGHGRGLGHRGGEHPRATRRRARRAGQALQRMLAHQPGLPTERRSAWTISAVEVAPGS